MTPSQPSLFDDPTPEPSEPPAIPGISIADSDWVEVSATRFLSWPEHLQWAYCARRDENTAQFMTDPEDQAWFLRRAADYQDEVARVLTI